MGKIKAFIGGYINKFYGEKSEYRSNIYLLVNKRGSRLDNDGFMDTFRDFHDWYEFDSIKDLNSFLDNQISKADRSNWVAYKRYASIPKSTNNLKG